MTTLLVVLGVVLGVCAYLCLGFLTCRFLYKLDPKEYRCFKWDSGFLAFGIVFFPFMLVVNWVGVLFNWARNYITRD